MAYRLIGTKPLPEPMVVQWNPSGEARNVSLKLQNLVHFHAPFFTNHIYFTPHDRPPLLKGPILSGLYWGVPLYIFNWTLRNKFQWNFNQNSYIFIQENAFVNVVCETAAILSRPQCVDPLAPRGCGCNCTSLISMPFYILSTCCKIDLSWMRH